MTAYFDAAHEQVGNVKELLQTDFGSALHLLREIEHNVAFDCTVCTEMPGFPEDLAVNVRKAILKNGVESLPVNAPPKDFETVHGHIDSINALIFDLHTVFHDVANRGLYGFSDNPRLPVQALYTRGEERLEQMIADSKED